MSDTVYYNIEVPPSFGKVGYNDWKLATNNKGRIFWGEGGHRFLSKLNGFDGVKITQLYFKTLQSAQNALERYYRKYLKLQ